MTETANSFLGTSVSKITEEAKVIVKQAKEVSEPAAVSPQIQNELADLEVRMEKLKQASQAVLDVRKEIIEHSEKL